MNLDWTTYSLEIINFLILVWLLHRFLYKPVLDVMERRRSAVEQNLAEAQAKRTQADQLKVQYENRLQEWNKEKEQARNQLQGEIETERKQRMRALESALKEEQNKRAVLEQRQRDELQQHIERVAIGHAARFASRLLSRVASPELEARLLDMLITDLSSLPQEQRSALAQAAGELATPVRVLTAHTLTEAQQERVTQALNELLGTSPHYEFNTDYQLIAGVRIQVGARLIQANVNEELRLFQEAAQHDA